MSPRQRMSRGYADDAGDADVRVVRDDDRRERDRDDGGDRYHEARDRRDARGMSSRTRAAFERLERISEDYLNDVERAFRALRDEIAAEREEEMEDMEELKRELLRGKDLLERERRDFDVRRAMEQDELERAYELLQKERDAFERERARIDEERVRMDAEARVHERYAKMGSVSARSMSLASQSFADGMSHADLRDFDYQLDPKITAWIEESGRERPVEEVEAVVEPVKSLAANRWIKAKNRVTNVTHALANATLTQKAETNAAAGILPDTARVSALDGIELMGRVLCIGGLERGSETPMREVEYIKPGEAENGYLQWKSFTQLNTPRAYAACSTTAIGGAVVIGGSDGNEALRSVEEYRESVGKWREVAPMSVPRIWCASTMIDGVTFACGGYDGEYYLHSMEANKTFGSFDYGHVSDVGLKGVGSQPESSWITCAPMSEGRATLGVANLSSKLYAIGGFSGGSILDICEIYDPRADTWSLGQPLKHARRDLGVACLNSRGVMLAIGGRDDRSVLNLVEAYDPRDAKRGWRDLASMQYRRQLHATVVDPSGDAVYAIGGFDGVTAISSVEVYDVRMDKWREVAPLSTARLGAVSCCIP